MTLDNRIQRGDLLQRLTRGLEIKGVGSPVLNLDPSLVPVVMLEDLTQQSEWVTTKDRIGMIGLQVAANATEVSGSALVNPTGSGIIVVVDQLVVSLGTSSFVGIHRTTQAVIEGTYAASSQGFWADPRNAGFTTCVERHGSDPGIGSATCMAELRVGSSNPYELNRSSAFAPILREGDALLVEHRTINLLLGVAWRWREISEP